MFSLAKLCYMTVSQRGKNIYDRSDYEVPKIDIQDCCTQWLNALKDPTILTEEYFFKICSAAVSCNHEDCLDTARIYAKYVPKENMCTYAAKTKSLSLLKFAREIGSPWSKKVTYFSGNSLECMKYAYENGCPWHENTCYRAAKFGRLDCLTYAHQNNCPWYENTAKIAAIFGQRECLRFALEIDSSYGVKAAMAAARGCQIYSLISLYCNGFNFDILQELKLQSENNDRTGAQKRPFPENST